MLLALEFECSLFLLYKISNKLCSLYVLDPFCFLALLSIIPLMCCPSSKRWRIWSFTRFLSQSLICVWKSGLWKSNATRWWIIKSIFFCLNHYSLYLSVFSVALISFLEIISLQLKQVSFSLYSLEKLGYFLC